MQVCFLESFAQPDAVDRHVSQRRSKFDQLRPSRVVIAGNEHALETVRTVHSPKSQQSPSRFAASPASSPKAVPSPLVVKRRGSFALSACAPQELSEAQVEDDQPHGWEETWTKKLLASGWNGKADVALALLGVVNMATHAAREADPSSSPFKPSHALVAVANGSTLAAAAYAVRHPDLFMELIQTLALLDQLLSVLSASRLPSLAVVSGVSCPVALAAVGIFVSHQWRWRLVFLGLTIMTALVSLTQHSSDSLGTMIAPLLALAAHTGVLFLRRVTSAGVFVAPCAMTFKR